MRSFFQWLAVVYKQLPGSISGLSTILSILALKLEMGSATAKHRIGVAFAVAAGAGFVVAAYRAHEKVRKDRDALIARQSALQVFVQQAIFRFLPVSESLATSAVLADTPFSKRLPECANLGRYQRCNG